MARDVCAAPRHSLREALYCVCVSLVHTAGRYTSGAKCTAISSRHLGLHEMRERERDLRDMREMREMREIRDVRDFRDDRGMRTGHKMSKHHRDRSRERRR